MDLVQAWVVVGVPGLVIAGGLFAGRSRTRALAGYVVLMALVAYLAMVPGGGYSAAAVGVLGALLVATGRGTALDERQPEHHQQRDAYTHAREPDTRSAP